jgi:hypothetical protein
MLFFSATQKISIVRSKFLIIGMLTVHDLFDLVNSILNYVIVLMSNPMLTAQVCFE